MNNFTKKPQTQVFKPGDENDKQFKGVKDYFMTTSKDEVRSNPESEDEEVGNFNNQGRYYGKRFAKADELIQKDILNLF